MDLNVVKTARLLFGLFAILCVTSCTSLTVFNPAEANHRATRYNSAESCSDAINTPTTDNSPDFLESNKIVLVNWNIEKGMNVGWRSELKNLAKNAQLVLLQEATFTDEMRNSSPEAVYWSFSPGYKTSDYSSGIMTISSIEPDVFCTLKKREPWLRSPKMSSITRFQLRKNELSLLVANTHLINFTLGTKAFSQQLEAIMDILKLHEGPIILSGDFNTWSQSRLDILTQKTTVLKLTPIKFSPDYRTKRFGRYLDHFFVRGLKVDKSYAPQVDTSDHNPLIATLSLQEVQL